MRTIKFRGMTLNGEWVYGNLTVLTENVRRLKQGHYISNSVGLPFAYQVRPETVGQYTGLKDKNGKEIYEGDVWKGKKRLYQLVWMPKRARYGAKIIKSEAVLVRGCTFSLDQYLEDQENPIEIIGNIYEYPHLIKEGTT